MQFEGGRAAVLSVHGTAPFRLKTQPFDAKAFEAANELPALVQGDMTELEGGLIKLYKYRAGYGGICFTVQNLHSQTLVFQQDCSGSRNVLTHQSSLLNHEHVPPGEAVVMHHLMPDEGADWAWTYSASYMFLDEEDEGGEREEKKETKGRRHTVF